MKEKEKKETKNANDDIKRYEVIDNKLEKTENRLSAVKEAKDNAFGVEKLQCESLSDKLSCCVSMW